LGRGQELAIRVITSINISVPVKATRAEFKKMSGFKFMKKAAPFIFFGIIIAFFGIKDAIQSNKLSKNHRYSAGTFYRVSASVDGGPLGEYYYTFLGHRINGSMTLINKSSVEIGKYYLVKFSPDNPKNCKIDIQKEIILSVFQTLPDSGWINPPLVVIRENIPEW
jgi:hypothetical protein